MSIVDKFIIMTIGFWIIFSGLIVFSAFDGEKSYIREYTEVKQGIQWNEVE